MSLTLEEKICIKFILQLREAKTNKCYINITKLQTDGSGISYTTPLKLPKSLGFENFDKFESWVTNDVDSLNVMNDILNPPLPHSFTFIAHQNLVRALNDAARNEYFVDVTNIQDNGTGLVPVNGNTIKDVDELGFIYHDSTLKTCSRDYKSYLKCHNIMYPSMN